MACQLFLFSTTINSIISRSLIIMCQWLSTSLSIVFLTEERFHTFSVLCLFISLFYNFVYTQFVDIAITTFCIKRVGMMRSMFMKKFTRVDDLCYCILCRLIIQLLDLCYFTLYHLIIKLLNLCSFILCHLIIKLLNH